MRKWQKEIKNSMLELQKRVPEYKERTEKETEELIHRAKVIDRKHQIELIRFDTDCSIEERPLPKYEVHSLKLNPFKFGAKIIINGMRQLLP